MESLQVIMNILTKYWPMFLRGAGATLYISMIIEVLSIGAESVGI